MNHNSVVCFDYHKHPSTNDVQKPKTVLVITYSGQRGKHVYLQRQKKSTDFHGGEISGELQTAVYLIMMTGASYFNIFMIYDIRYRQIYDCFQKVIVQMNDTFSYPFVKALQDKDHEFLKNYQQNFPVTLVVSIQDVQV